MKWLPVQKAQSSSTKLSWSSVKRKLFLLSTHSPCLAGLGLSLSSRLLLNGGPPILIFVRARALNSFAILAAHLALFSTRSLLASKDSPPVSLLISPRRNGVISLPPIFNSCALFRATLIASSILCPDASNSFVIEKPNFLSLRKLGTRHLTYLKHVLDLQCKWADNGRQLRSHEIQCSKLVGVIWYMYKLHHTVWI